MKITSFSMFNAIALSAAGDPPSEQPAAEAPAAAESSAPVEAAEAAPAAESVEVKAEPAASDKGEGDEGNAAGTQDEKSS